MLEDPLNPSLQDAINDQIQAEFYSAYLYLSMSTYCTERNLTGFASWMRLQAQEEVSHAMRLVTFMQDRGAPVKLQALGEPPHEFGSPLEIMQASLDHERLVTGRIHKLYAMASEAGDYPAQVEFQWFITEQVEEEASIDEIVQRLKMFGTDGTALLMVDTQLGTRTPEQEAE
ncbi:MAG: ferritin [Gemmatimonadota bacterium]